MVIKEQIMLTAFDLFSEHGIKNVSMDDIAHNASISKRTLYELFEDKETLLTECINLSYTKMRLSMKRLESEPITALEVALLFYEELMRRPRWFNRKFYDDLKRYPKALQKTEEEKSRFLKKCIKLLSRGAKEGVFQPNINFEIVALLAKEQAKMIRPSKALSNHSVSEVFNTILYTFLRGISTEKGIAILDHYLDIKHKFEQGTVAEYDLIRANVTVKNSEPNMLQAENALVLAKWQLKALLGMDLDINIECEGQLTDFEKDLFGDFLSTDTTLANNTDLKQMDLQAKQLEKTLTMQKFDYLPTLSLTGLYQWTAMNNDFKFKDYMWNPYSMVGVSLSIPIFSGGSKFYKIKQTRNSIEQLSLQREDTQRNLQLAIKQYIDNMNTCVKRFDASQKGVEQAERGYMISQKRYDTGAGTLLEMNDSELALTQAKLNFNQAIYDYMVAKADLEKVLGQQEF